MPDEKNADAVGDASKGGKARSEALSPEERKEIARNAARARWESSPVASNSLQVDKLPSTVTRQSVSQPSLFVDKGKEIDGIGMGVSSERDNMRFALRL